MSTNNGNGKAATSGLIGKSIKRVEDKRFTMGHGNYVDDIVLPGQTYAAFVRSQYAHANILSVDTAAAQAMPVVVAIYIGADDAAVNAVLCGWQGSFEKRDGIEDAKHPVL